MTGRFVDCFRQIAQLDKIELEKIETVNDSKEAIFKLSHNPNIESIRLIIHLAMSLAFGSFAIGDEVLDDESLESEVIINANNEKLKISLLALKRRRGIGRHSFTLTVSRI